MTESEAEGDSTAVTSEQVLKCCSYFRVSTGLLRSLPSEYESTAVTSDDRICLNEQNPVRPDPSWKDWMPKCELVCSAPCCICPG